MVLGSRGFTLLEAIVALVILSAGMMAAYTWFSQDISYLIKINNLSHEEILSEEIIERLEREDFSVTPQGNFNWGEYRVDWVASPADAPRLGRTSKGAIGLYELTRYRVRMELSANRRIFAAPELTMVKYRQVREPQFEERLF